MHASLRVPCAPNETSARGHASLLMLTQAVLLLAMRVTTAVRDMVLWVRVTVRLGVQVPGALLVMILTVALDHRVLHHIATLLPHRDVLRMVVVL